MYTIFLSSTFNDMQKERDAFHQVILPQLNHALAQYGHSAQLCDLRWGVNTSGISEEESTLKILNVCFDAIRDAIPFFVVMLGERYGWVPPQQVSGQMESLGLEYHEQSVTEMEIEYHDILESEYANHAIYLFREPLSREPMEDENQRIFFSDEPEAQEKLNKLKEKIRRENPGRVFSYTVEWDAKQQTYTTDAFSKLATEQLQALFDRMLGGRPSLTAEERVMNESAAYFAQRAQVCAENQELLTQCFRDLLKQVKGKHEWANEELREMYRESGKLEEEDSKDQYDYFRAVFLHPEGEETNLIAGVYQFIPRMELSREILPIPFVVGINGDAQNGQHLLACIVRAMEKKFATDAGLSWTDGEELRNQTKELIEYTPWEKYPENTPLGLRYYLEKLLNYARVKGVLVFLFVEHFERMTDTFARNLEFLGASGRDDRQMYLMLDMTRECYTPMDCLRTIEGSFVYELEPMTAFDRCTFIENAFSAGGKELPQVAKEALVAREESGQVSWLKAACDGLSELEDEDFAQIRDLGDGIGAIEQMLLTKIEQFPKDTGDLICRRLLHYGKTLNEELANYVYAMLSLTEYGVSQQVLERVAKLHGVAWNSLDFELLMHRFPYDIRRSENRVYSIFEPRVKSRLREVLHAEALLPSYAAVLKTLSSEAAEFTTECISIAGQYRDADWLWSILAAIHDNDNDQPELYFRLARALDGDGAWLMERCTQPIPETCLVWFSDKFYLWMYLEDRTPELISALEQLAALENCPDLARMNALCALSEHYDRDGRHEKASELFAKAFPIALRLREEFPADVVTNVSYYAYLGIWWHPEENERFAQIAYDWAMELEHTKENFKSIVSACYYWIRVFGEKESILTVNDRYQQIFDLYNEMSPEVCTKDTRKYCRQFFYELKLEYQGLCAEICDMYASFLAKNYRRVPEDLKIPCYRWAPKEVLQEGDFYRKVSGIEIVEETDFRAGAVYYRNHAINLAASKYSEKHSLGWLETWADCHYRQAEHKKRIGMVQYRNGDAYEEYEEAARGYEKMVYATLDPKKKKRAICYQADAHAGMGEVAKNFKKQAYSSLSHKNYRKAFELYDHFPVEELLQFHLKKKIRCALELAKIEHEERYNQAAFAALKCVRKETATLYYDYHCYFHFDSKKLCELPLGELTAAQVRRLGLSALNLAWHYYFGVDADEASRMYAENKAVKIFVMSYLVGGKNMDLGRSLFLYLRGYYFEFFYCKAIGDLPRAEAARKSMKQTLQAVLSEEQLQACLGLPEPEALLETNRNSEL